MDIPEPIGRLLLGTAGTKTGGKLVDEWTFCSPFSKSERFHVEVYMRKRHPGLGHSGSIDFKAHCAALPDGSMESTDIEALRAGVEQALREQAILKSGVTWEKWLEVIVRGGKRSLGRPIASEELVIEYKALLRGRHPELPGGDYTINTNHCAVKFPQPKKAGFKSDGEAFENGSGFKGMLTDGRDVDAEYSYIVDSPENREALDGLIESLRTLRARLGEFLGQDGISSALVTLQAKSPVLALKD
jgi:hypothetical protein